MKIQTDKRSNSAPNRPIPDSDVQQSVALGLADIAQTYARRDVPRADKFRSDGSYARKGSFLLDPKLFLLSFGFRLGERGTRGKRSGEESRSSRPIFAFFKLRHSSYGCNDTAFAEATNGD